jgi:hypothetical protein
VWLLRRSATNDFSPAFQGRDQSMIPDLSSRQRRLNSKENLSHGQHLHFAHYHIIFSTKNREPWLVTDIEQRVWAFIGGIARALIA